MSNKAETMKKIYIVLAIVYSLYAINDMIISAESISIFFDLSLSFQTLFTIIGHVLSWIAGLVSICFIILRFTLYNKRNDRHKFFSLLFIITGVIGIISSFNRILQYFPITIYDFEILTISNIIFILGFLSILKFFLGFIIKILSFFVAYELRTQKAKKIFSIIFIALSMLSTLIATLTNTSQYPLILLNGQMFESVLFSFIHLALLTVAIFDIDNKTTIQTEEIATEPQTDATETQADTNET